MNRTRVVIGGWVAWGALVLGANPAWAQEDLGEREVAPEDADSAEPEPPPAEPPAGPTPVEVGNPGDDAAPDAATPATTRAPSATSAVDDGSSEDLRAMNAESENDDALGPTEESDPERWGQRHFAFTAMLGQYTGFGGGVRGGWHRAGVDVSVGYNPILLFLGTAFEGLHTAQINADAYVMFNRYESRFHAGITPGYKYSTLLGHGGGLSFYGLVNFTQVLALRVQVGISVFPEAERGVTSALPACNQGNTCQFSLSPAIQGGFSVGLAIFP